MKSQGQGDIRNNSNPADTSSHLEGSEINLDLFLAEYAITLPYSSALYIPLQAYLIFYFIILTFYLQIRPLACRTSIWFYYNVDLM